ncbi:hypothetical protein [Flavobacterium nitrogenifigens]|uniref:Uncharacterized protein n=1 Tax=Flavobacterium nitrogenifigens TaxID=1617283 RepID=A0A521FAQ9_9FLAO|nr:hypothetical protein [Flavobacterium nitrogenifigens]KAF2337971.1 hypothetical protein DM397_03280 [Flavobacterium nitrogenifigens]SMO93229.1 hypothetical protein SAMN06265220_10847 [Flavobacterium nitrogenifigens]
MNPKELVIENLKIWIKKTNIISYDKDIGLQFWDKELRELRGEIKKEVYVISFKTEDKIERNKNDEIISLFEGMYCFAYFDAETLELLYIHKKAGYIEVDGSY